MVKALRRVVDTDVYDVHVDDRPKGSLNGQQNTGFAFKRGLTAVRHPDFEAIDIRGDGRRRYGARIELTHNGQMIQRMAVHLKSGCAENTTASSACAPLLAQAPVLGGWSDAVAQGPMPFLALGGVTRPFTRPHDQGGPTATPASPPPPTSPPCHGRGPVAGGTTRAPSSPIASSSTDGGALGAVAPRAAT